MSLCLYVHNKLRIRLVNTQTVWLLISDKILGSYIICLGFVLIIWNTTMIVANV